MITKAEVYRGIGKTCLVCNKNTMQDYSNFGSKISYYRCSNLSPVTATSHYAYSFENQSYDSNLLYLNVFANNMHMCFEAKDIKNNFHISFINTFKFNFRAIKNPFQYLADREKLNELIQKFALLV